MLLLAARGQRTPSGDEQAELQPHLDGCERCRTLAAELAGSTDLAIGETVTAGSDPDGTMGEPLLRGDSIGRFLLLGQLGKGGMGVVYSSYDPDLDRKVAIKLLHPSTSSEDNRTRLLREAQA